VGVPFERWSGIAGLCRARLGPANDPELVEGTE